MNSRRLAALAAMLAALALGACSSAVTLDDAAPIEQRGGPGTGPGGAAGGAAAGAAGAGGVTGTSTERPVAQVTLDPSKDPLTDPANPLSKRSVYFDFDSFTIRDEFRPVVETHAKFMLANKNRRVVVQGNTDDRGSREYNLALGQKRAEAVRRALMALGVPEPQIEAVSFGEEKPRATGSDEASWAENRRADIVYP
jgi:peptidoglycan-associated lipoprotein